VNLALVPDVAETSFKASKGGQKKTEVLLNWSINKRFKTFIYVP
jgi:hypothetical protein